MVRRYFSQLGVEIADFNGDRVGLNLVLSLPCYDEKLKKFAFGEPLNWYPPFGVTAAEAPEGFNEVGEKELWSMLAAFGAETYTKALYKTMSSAEGFKEEKKKIRVIRTCLLLSMRLTYWCNYHLKRVGMSIFRAPPIRHNQHVIDLGKRFVPLDKFFHKFQRHCKAARLCPMTDRADKGETHAQSLTKGAELYKLSLKVTTNPNRLYFPEEEDFLMYRGNRDAERLVDSLPLVEGRRSFYSQDKFGGPHVAEHLEKDYGRKAHHQGQVLCLLNALLGCKSFEDLLCTGHIHVNGYFHYLLLTRPKLREVYGILRYGLTNSHGCDLSMMLGSTLAVICELEDGAGSKELGKVSKLVAGALAYPLIV